MFCLTHNSSSCRGYSGSRVFRKGPSIYQVSRGTSGGSRFREKGGELDGLGWKMELTKEDRRMVS